MPLMGSKEIKTTCQGPGQLNTACQAQVGHGLRQGTPNPETHRPLFPGVNPVSFWEETAREMSLE